MPPIYPDPIARLPQVDQLFTRIGWQIDQLMSIDTRGKGHIPALYRAAVALINAPLAMTAAQRLREVVAPGDVVGIITGFRWWRNKRAMRWGLKIFWSIG